MKFTFTKEVLLKEMAIAQEIISNKTAISILSNVLLIAKEGSLTIRATDIKVAFETKIPVDVAEEGATTVFCDKFTSIIASMPSGEIEAEQKDQKLIIRSISKKAKFSLKTISDNDFPPFTDSSNIRFFDIPTKDFKEILKKEFSALDPTGKGLDGFEDLILTFTVDKKTFLPVNFTMVGAVNEGGIKMNFSFDVKYSNINNVKEIIIPKEALEAKEEKSIEEQLQETNKIENTEKDDKVDKKF